MVGSTAIRVGAVGSAGSLTRRRKVGLSLVLVSVALAIVDTAGAVLFAVRGPVCEAGTVGFLGLGGLVMTVPVLVATLLMTGIAWLLREHRGGNVVLVLATLIVIVAASLAIEFVPDGVRSLVQPGWPVRCWTFYPSG